MVLSGFQTLDHAQLEQAVAATGLGIWDWDYPNGDFLHNDAYLMMLGYAPDEVKVDETFWLNSLHPDDWAATTSAMEAYIKGRASEYNVHARLRTKSGQYRWVNCRCHIYTRHDDGTPKRIVGVHKDIHEETTRDGHLESLLTRLNMALDGGDLAIWDWDLINDTVETNDAWLTQLGYEADELERSFATWESLVHPDDLAPAIDALNAHVEKRRPLYEARVRMRTKSGEYRWILCRGKVSRRDEQGRALRAVGIQRDISIEIAHEQAMAQAAAAAQKANEAKTQFLANMSHELRTPMAGVLGMLDLIEADNLTADQKRFLEYCRISSRSLLALVDDILDHSRLELGSVSVEQQEVDPHEILQAVVSPKKAIADKKGIRLTLTLAADVPELILTDERKLFQIVTNLVSNAIKFTESGEINLCASYEAEESDSGTLIISVKDTGIGISEADQERIFRRFEQVEGSNNRRFQGAGLGLAIVTQLVDVLGGQINLESQLGEGACFTVRIPCLTKAATREQAGDNPPAQLTRFAARILVAEDNDINQKLIGALLTRFGFDFEIVDDGQKALISVQARNYDLILMDLQMPHMNGLAATQAIRRLGGRYKTIPIIGLTADAQPETRQKLLAGGMNDCLTKPIDKARLFDLITLHTERVS